MNLLIVGISTMLASGIELSAQYAAWQAEDSVWLDRWDYKGPLLFTDIAAADTSHCIAVGRVYVTYMCVRRTTNGGRDWETTFENEAVVDHETSDIKEYALYPHRVIYPTPNLCLIAASRGTILRSTDRGATFSKARVDVGNLDVSLISLHSATYGIARAGFTTLVVTKDSGSTWTPFAGPQVSYMHAIGQVHCFGDGRYAVLVVGQDTNRRANRWTMYVTQNNGSTWIPTEMEAAARPGEQHYGTRHYRVDMMHSLAFGTSTTGIAVGGRRIGPDNVSTDFIWRSTDRGASWYVVHDEVGARPAGLFRVAAADSLNYLACSGFSKLLRSTDAGISWRDVSLESRGDFWGVTFPTKDRAWLCTNLGTILGWRGESRTTIPVETTDRPLLSVGREDASLLISVRNHQTGLLRVVDILGNVVSDRQLTSQAGVETMRVAVGRSGTYVVSLCTETVTETRVISFVD